MNKINITESKLSGMFYLMSSLYPKRVFLTIMLGALAGVFYALVIPLIMMSINQQESLFVTFEKNEPFVLWGAQVSQPGFFFAFLGLCAVILALRTTSQMIFNKIVIRSSSYLRQYIVTRINQLPLDALERIGHDRLTVAFTFDLPRIMNGAAVYPQILINLASVLGIMMFLAFLDIRVFWLVTSVVIGGIILYRIPTFIGQSFLNRSRDTFDHIQSNFTATHAGHKELKLNREKRLELERLNSDVFERNFVNKQVKGQALIIAANNAGGMINFLIIAFATFILADQIALSNENLISTVMAILYLSAPLNSIMNLITPLTVGMVSLRKLQHLLKEMPLEVQGLKPNIGEFDSITLDEVGYRYGDQDGFQVGPVNVTLKAGEITVITGGNGSGKSTISKVISCQYRPSGGAIYFGKTKVDAQNIDTARSHISTVFTDFYLFQRLFIASDEHLKRAQYYLDKLGLKDKVSIENGCYSTIKLSDGQKKRLALINCFLEDRKICLFDEWAADQDPYFRKYFYTEILPELKKMGKIVVIVSHDDKYFDIADQLIRMEDGQLINLSNTMPEMKPEAVS